MRARSARASARRWAGVGRSRAEARGSAPRPPRWAAWPRLVGAPGLLGQGVQGGQEGGAGLGVEEPVDGDAVADGGDVQVAAGETRRGPGGGPRGVDGRGPAGHDDGELGGVEARRRRRRGSARRRRTPAGGRGWRPSRGRRPAGGPGRPPRRPARGEQRHLGQAARGEDPVAGLPGARRAAPRSHACGVAAPSPAHTPEDSTARAAASRAESSRAAAASSPATAARSSAGEECSHVTRPARPGPRRPRPAPPAAAGGTGSGETVTGTSE